MQRFSAKLGVLVMSSAISCMAQAAQLNWDDPAVTWTPGNLSASFDIDSSSPGNDVTITMTGATSQFQPSLVPPNLATPGITRAFDGGFNPGHNTLELALNLTNNSQSVTVTLDFSGSYAAGVSNVSFNLFDIDYLNGGGNTYQDMISSITAISTTGTLIAPTITNVGPNLSLTGSGLTQVLTGITSTVDLGAGSGDANASISFDSTAIRSISFTYGSGPSFANPTYQHIGIDNLLYVVPEPDSSRCLLIGGATIVLLSFYRRVKRVAR